MVFVHWVADGGGFIERLAVDGGGALGDGAGDGVVKTVAGRKDSDSAGTGKKIVTALGDGAGAESGDDGPRTDVLVTASPVVQTPPPPRKFGTLVEKSCR